MTNNSKERLFGDDVFTVTNLLSPEECSELIEFSESKGYEAAAISLASGRQEIPEWRNNTRVIVNDQQLAARLWEITQQYVPDNINGWKPSAINDRIRFYRYEDHQQFDWHTDGFYRKDDDNKSFLTFLVYLNNEFTGGETSFSDRNSQYGFNDFSICPQDGLALFFAHYLPHKGEPVRSGRKYVLRSDVMYTRIAL